MLTQRSSLAIFDKLRKYCSADEVECSSQAGAAPDALCQQHHPPERGRRESRSVVAVSFDVGSARAAVPPGPAPISSMTKACAASQKMRKRWSRCNSLILICSRCRHRRRLLKAKSTAMAGRCGDTSSKLPVLARKTAHEAVAQIVDVAKRNELTTAGIYATSEFAEGLFNSRGVSKWHEQTSAEASITMIWRNFVGMAKSQCARCRRPQSVADGGDRGGKGKEIGKPARIQTGKYTVILEPSAVLDILGLHVLGLQRIGAAGTALIPQRSRRHPAFW